MRRLGACCGEQRTLNLRLVELVREVQLASGLQIRIEHSKDGSESTLSRRSRNQTG